MKYVKSGVLLLVAAGLLAACAEEREPINRVQPYALPKSFFIGADFQSADDNPEFWSQNTLIDVGYGASQDGLFTSTYAQPLSRVKWQITEDYLIGRSAYERITGSDGKGVATGDETEDGDIAVMFAIQSQFDIVNAYNSTTGEKLNVVEENNYDRPWYEREYIRVDFSKSLMSNNYDFDTASLVGIYGAISYEPLAYYVSDPQDEQAPVFDLDNGYFDVTTRMWATPGLIDLSDLGWGINSFPACYLDADFRGGSFPVGNCNPVELTLRHSFRRVVDHDIVPFDEDGFRFQAFGAFNVERRGYDRQYGVTDNEFHRFQYQYPIWERSHYYADPEDMTTGFIACNTPDTTPVGEDPHRDLDADGTEDECAAVTTATNVGGSQCDEFSQKCTLPYRARVVKTMPWYVSNGSDLRYFIPSQYATQQWDAALRSAIVTARYTECIHVETAGAGSLDTAKAKCLAENPVYFGQADANDDLIFLSQEMDDCRTDLKVNGVSIFNVSGEVGSDAREAACAAIVDTKGAAIGAEAGVIAQAKMAEVVTLCHSPVEIDDPPICGTPEQRLGLNPITNEQLTSEACANARAAGEREVVAACQQALNVRLGDLRYHTVNLIETPQTPSPWGIMVTSADPLNGETIATSVNVWTWVNDFWGARAIDYMRFAAGELSADQVTEGENIKDWTNTAQAAERGGVFQTMTKAQRDKRVADTLGISVAKLNAISINNSSDIGAKAKVAFQQAATIRAQADVAGENETMYRARMNAIKGTTMEAELMNLPMQQLNGVVGLTLTDGVLDLVSPIRGGNPGFQAEMKRLKQNALGERGMCEMEMADAPVSITGLSAKLQEKFGAFSAADSLATQEARATKMAAYLAKWAHASVIAHEMGHTVGHRHNFVSSSDAWNFMPQYWALRTKANTVTTACTDLSADGENCIGQRYFDPITPEERDNMIWMWEFSSIMDYAGETSQDLLTIGAWDFAATRMFYGDSVAVMTNEYQDAHQTPLKTELPGKLDYFGGLTGFTFDSHYSMLAQRLDLIPECETVDPSAFQPTRWDATVDGPWGALLDGHIVNVDGVPTRCRTQKIDYARWADLLVPQTASGMIPCGNQYGPQWVNAANGEGTDANAVCTMGWVVDKFDRYRWPYGFATDHWADLGNAAVYRHDNGADTYEIFNFLTSQQEIFSIFDNYRRGRSTFTLRGAVGRINERYLAKVRDGAKGLSLYKNWYRNLGPALGITPDSFWNYAAAAFLSDNIVASTMAFDHFTRNAQRPAPGSHCTPVLPNPEYNSVLRDSDGDNTLCDFQNVTTAAGQMGQEAGKIPNGAYGIGDAQGGFLSLAAGGKVVENQLLDDQGDFNSSFTKTAGAYYDKIWTSMLFTESADNFISESRGDFIDKRYRSCSLADLFSDAYRRWLGNNLTNDDFIKGARVACTAPYPGCPYGVNVQCDSDSDGEMNTVTNICVPDMDDQKYWNTGIGWTHWMGDEVTSCFPQSGSNVCAAYNPSGVLIDIDGEGPESTMAIDPELAWEVQKYLVTWTYIYLPENQMATWRDLMRMYSTPMITSDTNVDDYLLFYNPTGNIYLAKQFGQEQIFGKTVEKGVSARVVQYANELLTKAYVTEPVYASDGTTVIGYQAVKDTDGNFTYLFDESMKPITTSGQYGDIEGCNETENWGCTCEANRSCLELEKYISVLDWLAAWSGVAEMNTDGWDDMIGIYN